MEKKLPPMGFLRPKEEPEPAPSETDLPAPLMQAINSLCENYMPVATIEQCNGLYVSTKDVYEEIHRFYPGKFDASLIAELLCNKGWESFYHPILKEYFWRVKKV